MRTNHPTRELYEFALEQFPAAPIAKRIRLYRAMALVIGSESEARDLNALANELEAIEARHEQLVLDFKRRAGA